MGMGPVNGRKRWARWGGRHVVAVDVNGQVNGRKRRDTTANPCIVETKMRKVLCVSIQMSYDTTTIGPYTTKSNSQDDDSNDDDDSCIDSDSNGDASGGIEEEFEDEISQGVAGEFRE
eukprot:339453_1